MRHITVTLLLKQEIFITTIYPKQPRCLNFSYDTLTFNYKIFLPFVNVRILVKKKVQKILKFTAGIYYNDK